MNFLKNIFSKKVDFLQIDSLEKAIELEKTGILEKILLFPEELGGENIPENTVYVPKGISQIKQQITNTLIKYLEDGLISKLNVEPEYKGNSFIPSRINIFASH